MKEKDVDYAVVDIETLYPTWFRWKALFLCDMLMKSQLYIPHGSDESLNSCRDKKRDAFLYIPHGSDERGRI